jgi:hypothetical protein
MSLKYLQYNCRTTQQIQCHDDLLIYYAPQTHQHLPTQCTHCSHGTQQHLHHDQGCSPLLCWRGMHVLQNTGMSSTYASHHTISTCPTQVHPILKRMQQYLC